VPDWGGAQAGLPGTVFAKILQDVETAGSPVMSYWKQALIVSDNRIPALASDSSRYGFEMSTSSDPVTITAELRFRRGFQSEMDARGWRTPDIVMERSELTLP
jgi:hypothetical protein